MTVPDPTDPLAIAKALLAVPSVTPARGTVFDTTEAILRAAGFGVERFVDGAAPDGPVENLLATRGAGGRHLAFAGHLDVVPPGEGWNGDPFAPVVRGDLLYGRGAVDMKGAIAAFIAAAARRPDHGHALNLILTGDEEGPAIFGTAALMEHMARRNIVPDLILVGEPTSARRLGDTMKIGRRGSVNIWITVPGRQGHVAYPHLADNPIPALVACLAEIDAIVLDQGNRWFEPSNIEITDLGVGNPATNIIPARAAARLSIRFNDEQDGAALVRRIEAIVHRHSPRASVTARLSGEAFLTQPGEWSDMVAGAVRQVTGITPEASTTGGTSDARFLSRLAPTVEFGLRNATMHQTDEAVAVADLGALTEIYATLLDRVRDAAAQSKKSASSIGAASA